MILERARGMRWEPGTNREGDPCPPAWAFLLPSLENPSIAVTGRVEERIMRGLELWAAPRTVQDALPEECTVLAIGRGTPRARIRLLLAGLPPKAWVYASIDVADEVAATLAANSGRWLVEAGTPLQPAEPRGRTALHVPAQEDRAHHWSARLRRVLFRAARRTGATSSAGRRGDPSGTWWEIGGRPSHEKTDRLRNGIVFPDASSDPLRPPQWLVACAANAGVSLAGRPWSLLPARGYRSQKLLFGFGPSADDPSEVAVKVTQHAAFNNRLRNEHRALSRLGEIGALDSSSFPRALFSEEHAGLAVVGEARIPGEPFRQHVTGEGEDLLAERAVAVLARLARETARNARGDEVGGALREIAAMFLSRYRPEPTLIHRIEGALRAIESEPSLPVVFVHGDPGDWNLLVDRSGRIAFLDWENAEDEGPPLWDLFAFLHSLSIHSAERHGVRPTPDALVDLLFAPSPAADRWVRAVSSQCRALSIPLRLVEPLLLLYWMKMALRETWRLAPDRLHRGRCLETLRRIAEGWSGSELARRMDAEGDSRSSA